MKKLKARITCTVLAVLAMAFVQVHANPNTSVVEDTKRQPSTNSVESCAKGKSAPSNVAEVVNALREAAEGGDAKAQFHLGECYENGKGVATNATEAIKWYRAAAEQGYVKAQYRLAMRYVFGRGVDKDEVEGGKWIRKAVDQGDADGQTILGRMYRDGFEGVKKDEAEAATWFRKAAEQGHAVAQYELGKVYDKGIHGEKNMTEAVIWYLKAAEQGKYELGDGRYKKVCKRLAHCYLFGEGVPKNVLIAAKWWFKGLADWIVGVMGGVLLAILLIVVENSLGRMGRKRLELGLQYLAGEGVQKDEVLAVTYFRKASRFRNSSAQFRLGLCYAQGVGVDKNEKEAVKWYRKAAKQGNYIARLGLWFCYSEGIGVERDVAKAEKWYPLASRWFSYCLCGLNSGGVVSAWVRKAAEQGRAEAQFFLGMLYANGEDVEKDEIEAVKWYRRAAEQGNAEAKTMLESMDNSSSSD